MAASNKRNRTNAQQCKRYLGFDGGLLTPLREHLTHLEIAVVIILCTISVVEAVLHEAANGTSTTIAFFALPLAFPFGFTVLACGGSSTTSGCSTDGVASWKEANTCQQRRTYSNTCFDAGRCVPTVEPEVAFPLDFNF